MINENWQLLKTITTIYKTYSDFDLTNILNEYNLEHNTNYTLEDITDYFIKYNILYLNVWDIDIEYEWIISDADYKYPDFVTINSYE